jgi:type VI secretion system protein ImpE
MSAQESLRRGDGEGALAALFDEVRAQPEQAKHRVFLFQLLSVAGQWDRALTQLNVARDLDPTTGVMAQAYQDILQCEAMRADVFGGKRTPLVFGEPEPWVAQLFEALRLDGQGEAKQAAERRGQALSEAPATTGTITLRPKEPEPDGEMKEPEAIEFDWLADGDTRLGPVLEIIMNGRYYWAPLHRIAQVVVDPPEDLRDLVWTPAHFRWANGGEGVGIIPTRYVASESHEDDAVRLARKTVWEEKSEDTYVGFGQRVLMTDRGEYAMMDLQEIALNVETVDSNPE